MGKVGKFDSDEEQFFSYYIDELIEAGYIEEAIYHPAPFVLSEPVKFHAFVDNGKKTKQKEVHLLHDHVYTADWKILWNKRARDIFYWQAGDSVKDGFFPFTAGKQHLFIPFVVCQGVTYFDIKGEVFKAGVNSSGITFPVNQKWVWAKYGLFVQKVIVSTSAKSIFATTFTPQRIIEEAVYKKDNKDKWKAGDTKLKFDIRTLEQFLKLKK